MFNRLRSSLFSPGLTGMMECAARSAFNSARVGNLMVLLRGASATCSVMSSSACSSRSGMIIVISVSPPSSSSARRFLLRGSPSESSSRRVELLPVDDEPQAFSDFCGRRGPASLASAGSSLARRGRRRGSSLAPALASPPSSSAQPMVGRGQPFGGQKAVAEQKAAGGRRRRVVPVGGRRLVWMLPDLFFSNRRRRPGTSGEVPRRF